MICITHEENFGEYLSMRHPIGESRLKQMCGKCRKLEEKEKNANV